MDYLVHRAHPQVMALWLSCAGWGLTAVALGLVQWRVWRVADLSVVTSGVAWVGIFKTCFNSHVLVTPELAIMFCRRIGLTEAFTPPEIAAAQVLMFVALALGFAGNACGVYALRNVHFGLRGSAVRAAFLAAGALCLASAIAALVPLLWNLSSVVSGKTIDFPTDFNLPAAPESQSAGAGIIVGILASVLMIVSGIIFSTYRLPPRSRPRIQPSSGTVSRFDSSGTLSLSQGTLGSHFTGRNNPAFESDDQL